MSTLACHPIADATNVTTGWRTPYGAAPLTYNQAMYQGAQWWAAYLATTQEWRHTTMTEAINNGQAKRKAEVIAMLDTATAWKDSAPHMAILTDRKYTKAGFAYCSVQWTNKAVRGIAVGWLDY